MTNLFATEKLQALYPKIKAFVEEELYPTELHLLQDSWENTEPILRSKREKAKALGIWAPHLPEEDGGQGLTMAEFGQVSELLGTSVIGHYVLNCQAPDIGNMELLHQFANDQLKEKYMWPLMNGDVRSCFGMTEPEFAGSNPVNMATTAVFEGDEIVLNGHKWFTTAADGAAFCVVMAVTDAEADPYSRASMVLVPTDTEGFELVRNIPIMGEPGAGYFSHAEIRLNNVRVPKSHLVGKVSEGFKMAQYRLGPGRIHHCMRRIGIAKELLI